MQSTRRQPFEAPSAAPAVASRAKDLYFALLDSPGEAARARAAEYLNAQLDAAACLPCDLPDKPQALFDWIDGHTEKVGRTYQAYLAGRQQGAPRRYFTGKAHALHFLRGVAPTKLVDGAWLYGLLRHFDDARLRPLIQTYLEELGEGQPDKNHVLLYRQLLARQGCEDWQRLDDRHFVQGAIQLALAGHAERFLPEIIGFNLGYEQLPLHLLISAHELTELGINPYYFTLHVTVDNASSGHARQAVQGLLAAWPQVGDGAEFYRRVANGYRLNELGASSLSVIGDFDLDRQVVEMLRHKSSLGRLLHSDYCRVGGRTVNQWLSEPAQIGEFLAALEQRGWIKRHQDPRHSRFWQLLEGDQAQMFGVFSGYERQLLHDWIAGDWQAATPPRGRRIAPQAAAQNAPPVAGNDDFDHEQRLLRQQLARTPERHAQMRLLLPLLAPSRHYSAAGLLATRIFARLL